MRLNQVEQVLAIARAGSISQAAQELLISQPNLSASIRELENELGQKLFERSGKGVVLTPFGSEFIAYAEPAQQYYQNLEEFCSGIRAQTMQRLTVASGYFRFTGILFGKLCTEYQTSPYEFSFLEGSTTEVVRWVHSQKADLGLILLTPNQKKIMEPFFDRNGLNYQLLGRQKLSLVVRKGHPLCTQKEPVSRRQLKDYPLVLYYDVNYESQELVRLVQTASEHQKIIVNNRSVMYELLAATDAYTLGAHSSHAYKNVDYYSQICALELADLAEEMEIGYITSRRRALPVPAQEYLERLKLLLQR